MPCGEIYSLSTCHLYGSNTMFGDPLYDPLYDPNNRFTEGTTVGDPYAALQYYHGQQLQPDTCGPNAVAHAAEIITGHDVDPRGVIDQARLMGLYHAAPGDWGMKLDDIGRLMQAQGIPTTFRSGLDPLEGPSVYPDRGDGLNIVHDGPNTPGGIIYELYHGNPVILAVDAMPGDRDPSPNLSHGVLWDKTWNPENAIGLRGIDPPDHVVTVKALEMHNDRLEAVIADTGVPDGAISRLPFDQLMDACDGGGCAYIAPEFPHTFEPSKNLDIPALRNSEFEPSVDIVDNRGADARTSEVTPESHGFIAELQESLFGDSEPYSSMHGVTPAGDRAETDQGGFLSGLRDAFFGWADPSPHVEPPAEVSQPRQADPEPTTTSQQHGWLAGILPWQEAAMDSRNEPSPTTSWVHETSTQNSSHHHTEQTSESQSNSVSEGVQSSPSGGGTEGW